MLDHEQRVAFVTQVMHHAHKPADVARMKSDAGLVHDEKRIHKRRAQARRQINALHLATAEGAGGAIKREITDAHFAKIIEPRANFAAQHFRGRVVR